jgi:membrane AbrB-like protein
VGAEYGGDQKTIVLNHTVRVMIVAFIIPFSIFYFQDIDRSSLAIKNSTPGQPLDYLILLLCGLVGMWLGIKLKIPAGPLAVPLILSAFVHIYGFTLAVPPDSLIIIAQIVLGSAVGARLSGITVKNLRKTCLIAFSISIGVLCFSAVIAWLLAPILHIQPITLLLALAPGGVTEMSLIALATNQDIAFVTTHHVVRLSLLIIIGPLTYMGLQYILRFTRH